MLDDECAIFGVDEHTAVIIDLASDTLEVKGRGRAYWLAGEQTITLDRDVAHPLSLLPSVVVTGAVSEPLVGADEPDSDEPNTPEEWGEVAAAGGPAALGAIARLVTLAASGGPGRIDPRSLVEGVLAARARARPTGQYALADQLRDLLLDAGIEVRDTPSGATWQLAQNAR
jgi:cysteinyl-tRNA synthetase